MTLVKPRLQRSIKSVRSRLWFEKIMAILVLINFFLVLFNYSYIPLRDFWLEGRAQVYIKVGTFERNFPEKALQILPFRVADWYDWVKGIEPDRETQQYLKLVEDLKKKINQDGLQTPEKSSYINLNEGKSLENLIQDLQNQSLEMIEKNYFQIANKTGTLERIKNEMREHVFGSKNASAKEAFRIFWSQEYLTKKGIKGELNFFEQEIKPLIETNYFRPVDENGQLVDNFILLDLPFFLIFLIEFLFRTWYISRRHVRVSWLDAMLWRWYDIFLLLPFFRLLRIITVTVRLQQAQFIDLEKIKKQTSQGLVAGVAQDMTKVIVITVINQLQASLSQGKIRHLLSQHQARTYLDLNNINETKEIIKLISKVIVEQVLPKIRPDVEAVLKHSLDKIAARSPIYQGMKILPGAGNFQTQINEEISLQIYQIIFDILEYLISGDPILEELLERLAKNFSQTMSSEFRATQSMERIEYLVIELLEEIKINYIENLSEEDIEAILEQTRAFSQTA